MGLVSIKLLGRFFSSNAGDSLPGARPASSTTRKPCSGGEADIICSTMYSSDSNVTDGGVLERGRFRRGAQPWLFWAPLTFCGLEAEPLQASRRDRRTRAYLKGP